MIVNVKINVPDETRRRVRAHYGRGGVCTRSEFRTWVQHLISEGKEKLPAPKTRACNTSRIKDKAIGVAPDDVPAHVDAACANCGFAWADHTGRRSSCPLSKSVKPGSVFKAVQA